MTYLDKKHILTINLTNSSIDYSKNIRFYNSDRNIANLYAKIMGTNDNGLKFMLQESDLKGLTLKLTVIKPKTNQFKEMIGIITDELNDETCAIIKFDLPHEFTDQAGVVHAYFELTDGKENGKNITIDPFTYEIKLNKLTELNAEIESNPDKSILEELIEKVKETAQTVNNIDNENISDIKTYSNQKIETKLSNIVNRFSTSETDTTFIIKYDDIVIAKIPLPQYVYGNIIVDVSALEISEGSTDTFTVKLDQSPTINQTVNITSDNENITIYPASLVFTSSNYYTPQTLTVTAEDDNVKSNYNTNITLTSKNVSDVIVPISVINTDETILAKALMDIDLNEYDTATTFTNIVNNESFTKDDAGNLYIGDSISDLTVINSNGALTFAYLINKSDIISNAQGLYGVNIKKHYDSTNGLGWNAYVFNISIFYNDSAATSIYVPNTDVLGDITALGDNVFVSWTCKADGSVDYYINGTKVYSTETPSDWKTWNYLYGMIKNKSAKITSNFIKHLYVFNKEFTDSEMQSLYDEVKSFIGVEDIQTFSEVNIQTCESLDLYYEVKPYGLVNDNVIQVNDITKATVEGNIITGVSDGSTTLSITAGDYTKSFPVNVGKQISEASKDLVVSTRTANDVYIINPIENMKVGDNHVLWACIFDDTTNFLYDVTTQDNIVNITSDNPNVVSTQFGVLFANGTGTATITATDITGTKTDSFLITVEEDINIEGSNILNVDLSQFTFDIVGTTGTGITNAQCLVDLFEYATTNNYNKIIFPTGTYNFNGDYGTIKYPNDCIIDWNNSIIQLEFRNNVDIADWEHIRADNEYAYTMFNLENTSNCIVMNGKFYGENYLDNGGHHIEHELTFDIQGSCYNSRFINCEFSYAPGFNVNLGHNIYSDTRTAFKLDNAEIGGLTLDGSNDDATLTKFRTKDYISLATLNNYKDKTLTFGLGCMQGYGGYAYVKGRFYNIYFYDENKQFISKLDKCVQFEYYQRPFNSSYCKIEFYQDYLPTDSDPDFGGIVHIFAVNELKGLRFKNCKFELNQSTGLCPQGGTGVIIDGCVFTNNGFYDPSSHIDWEDGGQHIHGHIVKNCLFKSSDNIKHTIINVKSRGIVLYNNIFDNVKYEQRTEVENARIFKNRIINNSVFELSSKTDMVYAYNVHENEPTINTVPTGMTVWQFDNFKITQC